jgi:hypothetical protein
VIFVGRDTGFKILDLPNYNEAECRDANVQRLPDSLVGRKGDVVTIHAIFDGWATSGCTASASTGTARASTCSTHTQSPRR